MTEGAPATFTLTRQWNAENLAEYGTVVNLEVTGTGGFISGAVPASVTFAPAQTVLSVTIPTTGDAVDEADGAVTVRLVAVDAEAEAVESGYRIFDEVAPDGVNYGRATVAVSDDDERGVTVAPVALSFPEGSAGNSYTLVLDSQPTAAVTVEVTVPAGAELTVTPGARTFTPANWDRPQPVAVTPVADADAADDVVTLRHAVRGGDYGANRVTAAEVVVTITEAPLPELTIGNRRVSERAGAVEFEVELSAPIGLEVTVDYATVDGTAQAPADYAAASGTLTFPADSEDSRTIRVALADDREDEADEMFLVRLSGAVNATPAGVGPTAEATGTIVDDDVAVSFGQASYAVAEGESVAVTVKLSEAPGRQVEIPLTKQNQGGAVEDDDYSGVPASVTFGSADTEQSFTFTAVDDAEDDDGESVVLSFGAALPVGVLAGDPASATVAITDNDVTVSFGQASYAVAEGASVTVTVKLSGAPGRQVEIPLTKHNQGGAVEDDDYSGVPESVIFGSADTEQSFTITAVDDAEDDDGESVKLSFGATLPADVLAGDPASATVAITDGDVTVSFGQASYAVAEGASVTVTVKLSGAPGRQVEIPLTKENRGGAVEDDDYSGVPASVIFGSADTEQSFTVTAVDDAVDDDGESVKLSFGATLPADVLAGDPASATVAITDNDLTVSFGQADYTVTEGAGVTVTVKLSEAPGRQVVIPLTKQNQGGAVKENRGGAVEDDDYSGVPGSVTFGSANTEQTFTVTAVDDTVDDDGESVKLSGAPGRQVVIPRKRNEGGAVEDDYTGVAASGECSHDDGRACGRRRCGRPRGERGAELRRSAAGGCADDPASATVAITDNDLTVSFGQADYAVAEGASVAVTVKLSEAPGRQVVIPLTKQNRGGAVEDDYSGVPESVIFGSADTEQSFTVTAVDDAEDDDGESVVLGFGATLPADVLAGDPASATVAITDNDVTVSFGQADYAAEKENRGGAVVAEGDTERGSHSEAERSTWAPSR